MLIKPAKGLQSLQFQFCFCQSLTPIPECWPHGQVHWQGYCPMLAAVGRVHDWFGAIFIGFGAEVCWAGTTTGKAANRSANQLVTKKALTAAVTLESELDTTVKRSDRFHGEFSSPDLPPEAVQVLARRFILAGLALIQFWAGHGQWWWHDILMTDDDSGSVLIVNFAQGAAAVWYRLHLPTQRPPLVYFSLADHSLAQRVRFLHWQLL